MVRLSERLERAVEDALDALGVGGRDRCRLRFRGWLRLDRDGLRLDDNRWLDWLQLRLDGDGLGCRSRLRWGDRVPLRQRLPAAGLSGLADSAGAVVTGGEASAGTVSGA